MINTICSIMKISRSAYFKFKREKRPVMLLLEKYFDKEELIEFLETSKIQRLESFNNHNEIVKKEQESEISLELLKDYAHYSLLRKCIEISTKTFWMSDPLKQKKINILLNVIEEITKRREFDFANVKTLVLVGLSSYQTSLINLEHSNYPLHIIEFVEQLSKIEVYLLVKNPEKYLN